METKEYDENGQPNSDSKVLNANRRETTYSNTPSAASSSHTVIGSRQNIGRINARELIQSNPDSLRCCRTEQSLCEPHVQNGSSVRILKRTLKYVPSISGSCIVECPAVDVVLCQRLSVWAEVRGP